MTTMSREIREQPASLRRLLDDADAVVETLAADPEVTGARSVVIAARGSSDNAARYAQYLLGWRHRLPVALAIPSLITVYDTEPDLQGALVIGVSQSGQSPDVVAVLEAARRQGRPAIAVTNDPGSSLAAAASHVIDLRAGVERAVAATKTYSASIAALALVSAALEEPRERLDALEALRLLPTAAAEAVDGASAVVERFDRFHDVRTCVVVGRGLNYGTAFEVALKIKELTGVFAEPYSPADLLHGPIAAVDLGSPVILVAPHEPSRASVRDLLPRLRDIGADTIILSEDEDLLEQATTPVPLATAPSPWLTPVTAVVPGQVLAHRLAVLRGLDPDDPAGLTKVTRTR